MKTLSNTQFYSAVLCIVVLAAMAVIAPTLFFTGKLAYVQRHDFVTFVSGVGEAKCSVAKYSGVNFAHTDIRGVHYTGGFGAYIGHLILAEQAENSHLSTKVLSSDGYISYGPYAETMQDENNKVGWACQKAGGELTTI